MDGRRNNGGHSTAGFAGRKPKAEEQTLIEKLTPYDAVALKTLFDNIKAGEKWAVELFFKYRFGMPRQQIDHTTNGESIVTTINYELLSDATLAELVEQNRPEESKG